MKIIGHTRELAYLEALATYGRAPHALLFGGPSSIGKRLAARYFFWRLCYPKASPETFEVTGMYADVLYVKREDEARETTISQIRRVREFVSRTPFQLPAKLVLIDEAERLNKEAANALLKTLEEPAPNTYFILLSDRPRHVLPTLRSRSILISFRHVPEQEMLAHFSAKERAVLTKELGWIAGRPGLALRFIENAQDPELLARKEEFTNFSKLWKSLSIDTCIRSAERLLETSYLDESLESGLLAARTSFLKSGKPRLKSLARSCAALRDIPLNKRLAIEDMLFSSLISS